MFSPRLIAAFAVLATAVATPATNRPSVPYPITTITAEDVDSPWFSFPLFGNLFAPLWKLFPSFADLGPKIIADKDKFQIIVRANDYKKEDLKVKVRGDFIFVQGSHETKQDDKDIFASQFYHTYTLPANASAADVTADFTTDGYLIVTAPLKELNDKTNSADREVPITESGSPYQKEVEQTVTEDDRKETTTQADREEVTEKDNIIPHGNEVQP